MDPGTTSLCKYFGKGSHWQKGVTVTLLGRRVVEVQTDKGITRRHHDQIRKRHQIFRDFQEDYLDWVLDKAEVLEARDSTA